MIFYFEASWLGVHIAFEDYHSMELNQTNDHIKQTIEAYQTGCSEIRAVEEGYKEVTRIHFLMTARKVEGVKYDVQLMKRIELFGSEIMREARVFDLDWKMKIEAGNMGGIGLEVWR